MNLRVHDIRGARSDRVCGVKLLSRRQTAAVNVGRQYLRDPELRAAMIALSPTVPTPSPRPTHTA